MDLLSNLPNEILIKIFEDCKVLRLTQVSRKFNDIISNSHILMKKVQLLITEKSVASEIVKSQRKYQNIFIKFNYKVENDAVDIIKKFGSDVKKLEMIRCIVHEKIFHEILKSLPSIENLSIFSTFLKSGIDQEELEPLELIKLKELNFRNSDQKFLNFLRGVKGIKTLNIAFLSHQPAEVMLNFFENHQSIEVIDNLMVPTIEDTLLTRVINLPNLKKLSIEIDKLEMTSIRNLELENFSVKSLNIYGTADYPEDFNKILKIFKGLKSLEIEMNSMLEPLNIQQLNSMKLSTLIFNQCQGNFMTEIQSQFLKNFQTNDASFMTQNDWSAFAHRNPSIEQMIIKDESISNETFITITQDFRNLKHFELFFDPQRLTPEILNFICDHHFPRNIKTLKISERVSSNQRRFLLNDNQKENLKHRNGFRLILC